MTHAMMIGKTAALSLVCSLALLGCAANPSQTGASGSSATSQTPAGASGKPAVFANQLESGAPSSRSRIQIVKLEVYHLTIPLGSISRSEEFWKHVEEQQVDVGTYDLLRKNGWRVGIAPVAEWSYFLDIINGFPAATKKYDLSAGPVGANGLLELEMRKAVPYQNIFYFNDENRLHGRTYEKCDNLLNITLQQTPRHPDQARVTVCPTVRGMYRRYEVTGEGADREVQYVHPERLYDLNCQIDLPAGQFLVISPSPEVKWKASLGATFLLQDGAAEPLEQVILMVPRTTELEEVPSATPAGAVNANAPRR